MKALISSLTLLVLLFGTAAGCRNKNPDDDSGTKDTRETDDTNHKDSSDTDDWTEPREAEFALTYTDPTAATEWITSGNFSFGFNENGGGMMSCILPDLGEGHPERCDSLAGDPNLVAPGYGRGWQLALRDDLHSNRYNPTQGGFKDNYGTPTSLALGASCGGPGGRVYIAPYRLPIYMNHLFDWVEHEDIESDGYSDDNGNSDNDAVVESGISQLDEVRSEWRYTAYYEDQSNQVTADVAIIRHVFQTDYRHPPDAIHQFSGAGLLDNGNPVLDLDGIWLDLAPDEGAPASLQGPQVATPLDLASGIFAYSGRVRWSFGYDHALWIDNSGRWQEDEVIVCNEKTLVQIGEDQFTDLYDGNPDGRLGGNPANFNGQSNLPLLVVSTGGKSEVETANAVGLYLPENECNIQQTVGWNVTTGEEVYSQDRRGRVMVYAKHSACTDPPTKLMWSDPDGVLPDVYSEDDHTNLAFRVFTLGLLNPDTAPEGVIERFRMDLRILFGTPSEILAAVQELEAGLSSQTVNCEITPSCTE
jgi:predicted small lipoprotein YifL